LFSLIFFISIDKQQKTMGRAFKILFAVLVFPCLAGCSLKKAATTTIGKVVADGTKVLEREEDVDLARNSTPSLILTLEVLAQGNPEDKRMQMLLARSYGQYAFGFLEEDLIRYRASDEELYRKSLDRARLFYKRGKDYGLNSLWSFKKQEKMLRLPQDQFERELNKFGKKEVPNLFWAAFCWGGWINLNRDDPEAFVDTPRVEAMMKRVAALDPSYYFGSAHTFLGAIASTRPMMLGGDPKRAEEEFKAAIRTDEGYLMHKVLYAQFYAVQTQNKALFESVLSKVKDADAVTVPEQRLANELAKRRAVFLLEKIKTYF
jgi:hypothetical protein